MRPQVARHCTLLIDPVSLAANDTDAPVFTVMAVGEMVMREAASSVDTALSNSADTTNFLMTSPQ
jgi:hypothetical protein